MFWTGPSERITDFTRSKNKKRVAERARRKKKQAKKRKSKRVRHLRPGYAILPDGKSVLYAEYIQSDEWQKVKRRYRKSKLPQFCQGCGRAHVEYHHRTYERLGHEKLSDLVPVCRECHEAIHEAYRRGTLDLLRTTRSTLRRLRKKNGAPLPSKLVTDAK